VLIPTACRVFENALRLPLAPPHVKQDFRPSPRSQIDELAGLRRFVPTGESGEASTHAQSVGCFGYRWLALPKFLALSTQPFELGPGAIPLASGVKRLFAALSLLPYSNLRRCRSLARLHLRSQQPAAFQLSLFATGPGLLFFLGALVALLVERRNPKLAEELTLPVASGVVAGGSLMGVALVFWANGGGILSKLFGR
jgi:hypothetical protein